MTKIRIALPKITVRCYNIFCAAAFLSITHLSCDSNSQTRGYEYFPDMAYSEAFETYAPNPIFADGKTAQAPVHGTIPRRMVPYQYSKTKESMKLAGAELKNPIPPNEEAVERGKYVFNIFCANCHGLDGKGDGNLYASGKYPSEPPSLVTPEMLDRPDGEFYHIITVGSAIMSPFAALIRSEDKWKIIHYIKIELSTSDTI
jgi:mono/diheme cytochrome c family protein